MLTTNPIQIRRLSSSRHFLLEQYCEKWWRIGSCTKPIDKPQAEQAINQLYRTEFRKQTPLTIWCQSPWQMTLMHSLFRLSVGMTPADIERKLTTLPDSNLTRLLLPAFEQLQTQFNRTVPEPGPTIVPGLSGPTAALENVLDLLISYLGIDRPLAASLERICRQRFQAPFRFMAQVLDRQVGGSLEWHWSMVDHPSVDFTGHRLRHKLPKTFDAGGIWSVWNLSRLATRAYPKAIELSCELKPEQERNLSTWFRLAEEGFAFIFTENVCFASERPVVFKTNDDRRLHSLEGPALAFEDGFSLYAWQGVLIPKELGEGTQRITIGRIMEEENVEVRRLLIQKFGEEKFLAMMNARLVDKSQYGSLFKILTGKREPIAILKVVNATPEPDGTYKDYYLSVPPNMTTAKRAVAWTFNMEPNDYEPLVQT